MLNGRMASLLAQHAQLEADIQRELSVPMPDHVRVTTLKRRKLALKEQTSRHGEG